MNTQNNKIKPKKRKKKSIAKNLGYSENKRLIFRILEKFIIQIARQFDLNYNYINYKFTRICMRIRINKLFILKI